MSASGKIPKMNNKPIFRLEMLDPVDQLLVLTLRVNPQQETGLLALEQACRSFNDWSLLVSRAGQQGVISWTHEVLSRLNDGAVPLTILEELRQVRITQTIRIVSIAAGIKDMLNALTEAGIGHIVLKGPFLDEKVYPLPGLRFYSDVDVLVKEVDVDKAESIFAKIGYRLIDEVDNRGFFDRGRTQVHYNCEGCSPVDLHWELVNVPTHLDSIKIDMEEIWKAAVPVIVAGAETLSLSNEDLLIFQCNHMMAHHDFNRLLWFKDVEEVIRHVGAKMDWDLFVKKCERYGLKTFVYYSIMMSSEALGRGDVPIRVLDGLRPRFVTARLFEYLARKNSILNIQTSRNPAMEIWRIMRDERSKRYGAIVKRAIPEVDWYLECYPFLPRIKHKRLYYGAYPALAILRLVKRPVK